MNALTREANSSSFLSSDTINDDFFIDIAERKLKISRDEFKLRLVFISPAAGKNDNFASVVYRAKIAVEILATSERKFVNVIIKALLITLKEMKEFAIFDREIIMYQDAIASFEKIWRDVANEEVEFGPQCIKIVRDPYEVIVLDDLKDSGYEMLDRRVGVNFEQAKLYMVKLAKFHAASAVHYQQHGQISEHFDRMALMQNPAMTNPEQMEKSTIMFGTMFEELKLTVSTLEGCEKFHEKIVQWDMMKLMMVFMAIAEPMRSGFKVLNHGDGWINNMMFKSDEDGQFIEAKMIDFQLSFWGSPANDLLYFFVSSVADDVKTERFDDLIEVYHQELLDSLRKLNYDQHIPTLSELQIDLLEKGSCVGFHMMFVMFIAKYDSAQELDLEGLLDAEKANPQMIRNAFQCENYKRALKSWLPFLNKRGYLDTLLPREPSTPFMQEIIKQMTPPAAEQIEVVNEE